MMTTKFLFDLMRHMFAGFTISLAYGIVTAGAVWAVDQIHLPKYLMAYFVWFNCLVSGGLILGTSLFVFLTQNSVPEFIESTFDAAALSSTRYAEEKKRYLSLRRSLTFSTDFILVGMAIFYFCTFPVPGISQYFLIAFGCIQYALGVYVGRKLFYISRMLNAITEVQLTKNIFKEDELSYIVGYVNALSTLTIIFVYIHVKSYFEGPFEYSEVLGSSLKVALLLPAVIATPVLIIFNFYPRMALKRLYSRSIADDVTQLTNNIRNDNLSEFERLSYLIEYDRLAKEELRNRLKITLADLPIGITIIVMIVGWIAKPG